MKFFVFIFSLLLVACAPALYHEKALGEVSQREDSPISFFATENGDSILFPQELKNAYAEKLQEAIPAGCNLQLHFQGDVEEHYLSPWYLGIFILAPLWPAMPREDDIVINLSAELVCENVTVQSAKLLEEEHPKLFWYGAYRRGAIQKHANLIHEKLAVRLKQILMQNNPVDESIYFAF